VFGAAAVAGAAVGRESRMATAAHPGPSARPAGSHGDGASGEHADTGGPGGAQAQPGAVAHPVRGLAVAEGGLRLVVDRPELRRGRSRALASRIVDERGRAVRGFDVERTKRMHLILARRDLTGFAHLHPTEHGHGETAGGHDDAVGFAATSPTLGRYGLFLQFQHERRVHTVAFTQAVG